MKIFDGIQTVNYNINDPIFNVVISTTKPSNPKENTIWVNGTGNNWVYSITKPDNQNLTGWIWIQSGIEIKEDFQIAPQNHDDNKIYAYPIKAYSSVSSGTWSRCNIQFFINGEWINPEEGFIIVDGKTIITNTNWYAGISNGSYSKLTLNTTGKFSIGASYFNDNNMSFNVDAWIICKKLNLSQLKPTKLTVQWNKFTKSVPSGTTVSQAMPSASIRLFNKSSGWTTKDSSYNLLSLSKDGGGTPIDLTSYASTMKSYPYIGIFVDRGDSVAGVTIPFVTFELT
jgi:hypothetical protein